MDIFVVDARDRSIKTALASLRGYSPTSAHNKRSTVTCLERASFRRRATFVSKRRAGLARSRRDAIYVSPFNGNLFSRVQDELHLWANIFAVNELPSAEGYI